MVKYHFCKVMKMQSLCVCKEIFKHVVSVSERNVFLSYLLLLTTTTYYINLLTYLLLALNRNNVATISCRLQQCCNKLLQIGGA